MRTLDCTVETLGVNVIRLFLYIKSPQMNTLHWSLKNLGRESNVICSLLLQMPRDKDSILECGKLGF